MITLKLVGIVLFVTGLFILLVGDPEKPSEDVLGFLLTILGFIIVMYE